MCSFHAIGRRPSGSATVDYQESENGGLDAILIFSQIFLVFNY